jgi:predicted ATPase
MRAWRAEQAAVTARLRAAGRDLAALAAELRGQGDGRARRLEEIAELIGSLARG